MGRPASLALLRRLLLAASTGLTASTGLAACGGGDVNTTGSRTGEGGSDAAGTGETGISGSSGHGTAGSPQAGQGGSLAGTGGTGESGVGGSAGEGAGASGVAGTGGAAGGVVAEPLVCDDPSLKPRDADGHLLCNPGFGVCGEGCYVPGEGDYPTSCVAPEELSQEQILHMPQSTECGMRQANYGPFCGPAYSEVTKTYVPGCCYVGRVTVCGGRPLVIDSQGRTASLRPVVW